MLHECYRSVTGMLQECYRSVTEVLHECYRSVTGVLQECYRSVTLLLGFSSSIRNFPIPFITTRIEEMRLSHTVNC